MLKLMLQNILQPLLKSITGLFLRWAYSFDGVDDRGVFANRLVNADADIDISWSQRGINNSTASPRVIVAQSVSGVIAEREFVLRWNGNGTGMQFSVGGTGTTNALECLDGDYRVRFSGTEFEIYFNGQLVVTRSYARGAAREPSAFTTIGARNSAGTFTEFANGSIYNVRINGRLYPMRDRDQSIQLPRPTGLGDELITQSVLENPAVKGSQWTYLGDGRWQYIGDGTLNELVFLNLSTQPAAGFVEFEIESISGQLSCTNGAGSSSNPSVFNSVGIKRYFFTAPGSSDANRFMFKRNFSGVGIVTSCVIKNISFRPLWVAGSTETVTNGGLTGATTTVPSWTPINSAAFSYNAGALVITNSAALAGAIHQNLTLETGADYVVSVVFKGGTATAKVSVNADSHNWTGNLVNVPNIPMNSTFNQVFKATSNAANIAVFVNTQDQSRFIEVQSISVRKLASLCNPLTLVNTASTGWTQVDGLPLPLLRWAYNFDGVDDLGTFNTPIELGQDFDVQITVDGIQQVPAAGQDFIGSELNFKFGLDAITGRFSFLVGNGSTWVVNHLSTVSAYDGKRYTLRGTKVGTTYTFTINGEVSFTTTNANAVTPRITHIARRSNGTLSWVRGRMYDVRINGVLYPVADRNQAIQLPSPDGLGSEVLPADTLFVVPSGYDNTIISSATGFSVTKGSTASRVAKSFPAPSSSYLLEFNLDSIDAGTTVACFIRDGSTAGVGTIITSIASAQIGKNRLLFNRISGDANILFVSNVAANFVVSAVTIRQLGTCNPLTLSNTASTGWQEIEA